MPGIIIMVDCYSVIQMHIFVPEDVCVAARATLRAAEIQAKAARYAGMLTIISSVIGSVSAILAVTFSVWQYNKNNKKQYSIKNNIFVNEFIKKSGEFSDMKSKIDICISRSEAEVYSVPQDIKLISPIEDIHMDLCRIKSIFYDSEFINKDIYNYINDLFSIYRNIRAASGEVFAAYDAKNKNRNDDKAVKIYQGKHSKFLNYLYEFKEKIELFSYMQEEFMLYKAG